MPYLCSSISLTCIYLKKKKIGSCTPVLKVPIGDTLHIIGTHTRVHQCDLECRKFVTNITTSFIALSPINIEEIFTWNTTNL